MKGTHHEAFNAITLTPISVYLVYLGLPPLGVTLFWLHGMFHTFLVTPDNDIPSRSTKRLGFLGWIIDKMFKHRGLLHNPLAWTIFYAAVYVYAYLQTGYPMWWLVGGVTALYEHIVTDWVSTAWKSFSIWKIVKGILPW